MLNISKHIKLFSPGFSPGIRSVFFIFNLLFHFCTTAQQNLVPNGSFEEYNWCPNNTDGYYINACKYWTMPTLGTSDYFNACSTEYDVSLQTYLFSVPDNYIGYQYARTGIAYAGFVYTEGNDSLFVGDPTYSEYIQVKLKHALGQGQIYKLKFYVSNVTNFICGNTVGAYFSPIELNENTEHNLEVTPHYQSDLSVFFCDSTKWFEQSYQFVAKGTEQYLIIGVFTRLYESQTSDSNGNIISSAGQFGANQYLYIDDVSLTEVDFSVPNVFTPNNDGKNEEYKIEGLPNNFSLIILNRWGEKVFQTDKANQEFWDGTFSGKRCPDGVYFYILESVKDNLKKTGFIHLVR